LVELERYDEAEDLFQEAVHRWPDNEQVLLRLVNACYQNLHWPEALGYLEKAVAHFPDSRRVWLKYGDLLLDLYEFEKAEQVFFAAMGKWPEISTPFEKYARTARRSGRHVEALNRWKVCIETFPDVITGYIGYGAEMSGLWRFEEAESVLTEALMKWPDHKQILAGLANLYRLQRNWEKSITTWKHLIHLEPDNRPAYIGLIGTLAEALKFDEAFDHYKSFKESHAPRTPREALSMKRILTRLHTQSSQYDKAFQLTQEICKSKVHKLDYISVHLNLADRMSDFLDDQAPDLVARLLQKHPFALQVKLKLASLYIQCKRYDEACALIKLIPESCVFVSKDYQVDIFKLRAWHAHHMGEIEEAKDIWASISGRTFLSRIHSPYSDLKYRSKAPVHVDPDDIFLFVCVKDACIRLPWFLSYYRKIGVDKFFIIDNDSNDGTADYLLNQKDVHLFWTDEAFNKAGQGMKWINDLIEKNGKGNWCVFVDFDEFVVFPTIEDRTLSHLLRYMDRKGDEVFMALMLDMYGEHIGVEKAYKSGDDLLNMFPYFEANYDYSGSIFCPYRSYYGGFRRRVIWNSHVGTPMTKVPIIKSGRGIKYLGNHQTTPGKVSDVTGALLHFKFMGKETYEKESFRLGKMGNTQKYWFFAQRAKEYGEEHSFLCDSSIRYKSSEQLKELGLMTKPDDF